MTKDFSKFLNSIRRIHFVGIGGISMSAIATVMSQKGYAVSGSDMKDSETLDELKKTGIKIFVGHNGQNIEGAELLIYTSAVKSDNPELIEAGIKGIPAIERAVMLGCLIDKYKLPIGICGTHGKTTTTSMIASILLQAEKDPTVMVGGELPLINGNFRTGSSPYFVFESCEYSNSFFNFRPLVSVFLNIEADHLDFFKDLDDIINSFKKYSQNTKKSGVIIANAEDMNVTAALEGTDCKVLSFGIEKGDFTAKNIIFENGCASFDVYSNDSLYAKITLNVPGIHNVYNALASCAAAFSLGIDGETAAKGLLKFKGAKRRFELKYKTKGITIIDDYAHHPSEIMSVLSSAKRMGFKRIICIFQPHTYSRTRFLFDDFAKVLSGFDKVILADIYAAREKNTYGISSKDLALKIRNSSYFESFEEIADFVKSAAKEGDLIITMGAGDIYKTADLINDRIK